MAILLHICKDCDTTFSNVGEDLKTLTLSFFIIEV